MYSYFSSKGNVTNKNACTFIQVDSYAYTVKETETIDIGFRLTVPLSCFHRTALTNIP